MAKPQMVRKDWADKEIAALTARAEAAERHAAERMEDCPYWRTEPRCTCVACKLEQAEQQVAALTRFREEVCRVAGISGDGYWTNENIITLLSCYREDSEVAYREMGLDVGQPRTRVEQQRQLEQAERERDELRKAAELLTGSDQTAEALFLKLEERDQEVSALRTSLATVNQQEAVMYMVMVTYAGEKTGEFGPFSSMQEAVQCVDIVAPRPDVVSAKIVTQPNAA